MPGGTVNVWACAVLACLLAPGLQAGDRRSDEPGQGVSTYRVPQITEGETVSVSQISDEYIGRACTVYLKPDRTPEAFTGPLEPPGMTSYEDGVFRVSGEMGPLWQEGKFTVYSWYDRYREAFNRKVSLIPCENIEKIIFASSCGQKLRDLMTDVRGGSFREPLSALRHGDVVRIHRYRKGYTVDAEFVVDGASPIQVPFGRETMSFYGLSEGEAAKRIFFASVWSDFLGLCSAEFSRPLFPPDR